MLVTLQLPIQTTKILYIFLTCTCARRFEKGSATHVYTYVAPIVQLDILFVLMQVKLGTFLPIHRCAFSFPFNLKYFFVSLCKYNTSNQTFDINFIYQNLMIIGKF